MGRLAVVAGTSLLGVDPPSTAVRRDVATPWGHVALFDAGDHVLLQRHGLDRYVAPHAIEHRANLAALAALEVDRVLAIGSVGALRTEIEVGAFVAPDDFIALGLGVSTSDGAAGHRIPGFDAAWRRRAVDVWEGSSEAAVRDGGTYWQAIGPRFETVAEIELIRAHADVIGMTLAAECILAAELGLAYAAVCAVDNLANGVGGADLSAEAFEAGHHASRGRVLDALGTAVPALAAER
jgi:5'-methylthioinosine phosphorylase